MSNNDLMQIMNAMASGFNMNPPPPPPVRMACGDLRPNHVGMYVELTGRLIKKRVNRFMELRDRGNGACQLVILEDRVSSDFAFNIFFYKLLFPFYPKNPRVARRLVNMPENTIVCIAGTVQRRPKNSCNHTMPTGDVEIEVQEILNIDFNNKRAGDKRSYSTMSQQHSTAITSVEYKVASMLIFYSPFLEDILFYFLHFYRE